MSACEVTDEVRSILRALAKNRVEAGHTDAAEIIDAIHEAVGDHVQVDGRRIWKSEIADIVSGYGQVRKPSKNELQTRMNALKAELRDDARKADVAMGKVDPVAEKNAQRAASLRKQIAELDAQLVAGERFERAPDVPRSDEVKALEGKRDALRDKINNLTSDAKNAAEKASLRRMLDDIEQRLRGKRNEPKPPEHRADDAEVTDLKRQLDQARAQLADKRTEEGKRTELQNRISDLLQRLAGKEKAAKPGPTKDSAAVAELKRVRDRLQSDLTQLEKAPPKSKDAIRQEQIKRQIAAIEQRLRTGDFSKAERKPASYSDETLELQAELAKARRRVDKEMAALALKNQSLPAKLWHKFLVFRRAIILSSFHTLGKLTSAATQRMITTPTEEAIGSALRLIPGISAIDAKAPREGGGINMAAEAMALRRTFSRDTAQQMLDTAMRGNGKLDVLFGKDHHAYRGLLDVVGQIHGALKTPAKVNEFERALVKLSKFERKRMIAEGMTPAEADKQLQSPVTQAMLMAKAYEHGQRAILMNDNPIVSGYRMVLSHAKRHGAAGKTVAGALEYLLPIVKIPTNFVAETTSYAAGAPKAFGQLIAAGGVERLTPDQADYIMRNLKKQTVGASLLALGFMAKGMASGYYQQGDNKKKGLDEPGTMHIMYNGERYEVPKYLLHSPPMEILQMGATIRRIVDEGGTATEGAYDATKGVVGQIPFFDTMQRVEHAVSNVETLSNYLGGEVRNSFIPRDVQNIAKHIDNDAPRKPDGFIESIEVGIPGMRDNVSSPGRHDHHRSDRSH